MQNIQTELTGRQHVRGWPLGYLMEPMGWVGQELARLAGQEAALLADFLTLSKARMHAIAFVLAHADGRAAQVPLEDLCRQRLSELLARLGPCAPALKGIMKRLPGRVLTPSGYRLILELMADADTARILSHGPEIDDARLRGIADTPPALRPVVMATMEIDLESMAGLDDALRWLAGRTVTGSNDAILADLAARKQPRQLIARLRRLVEDLPLPTAGPPDVVGASTRIDSPAEVRQIAKAWRNCLITFQHRLDDGRCAVYRCRGGEEAALALVERHGRLGWFLGQVKGPENRDLPTDVQKTIEDGFLQAGLPSARLVAPLEALINSVGERFLD